VDLGFVFILREKRPVPWGERIVQLETFREKLGHLRVPLSDPILGRWVNVQRKSYASFIEGKKSSLTEEKVRELTALGFVFQAGKKRARDPTTPKKSWEERLGQLKEFKEEYGHCVVPQLFKGYPGLGRWVHKMRDQYKLMKQGKPCVGITAERALRLAEIGFVFENAKHVTMKPRVQPDPLPVELPRVLPSELTASSGHLLELTLDT